MKIIFGLFLISCLSILSVCGQDPLFSQYDNNPSYINPGKIGRFQKKAALFNQRFQSSVDARYNTSQFTFVLPIYFQQNYAEKNLINHKGGVGFSFLNDVSNGSFKTTSANINFAYNWKIDPELRHLVSFGMTTGFLKLAVDLDNYTWGEQYGENGFDPNYVPGSIPDEDRATVFDVGFGAYWTFRNKLLELNGIRNADAGLSISHLNMPNISTVNNNDAKLPMLIKFHSSLFYALNEKYFIGARLLYLQQHTNHRVNFGGLFGVNLEKSGDYISGSGKSDFAFILKEFYLDAWLNTNKSFGMAANFDLTSARMGFSYEPNYSTFSVINKIGSAYELFLQVTIPDRKK